MFGGAELPILWVAVFLAALAESALRFASLAKIEEELNTPEDRERFARYLDQEKALSAFCVLVGVACGAALVVVITQRAAQETGRVLPSAFAAAGLLGIAQLGARAIGRKWSTAILLVVLRPLHCLSFPLHPVRALGQPSAAGEIEEPEPEVVDAAKEEIRVALEDGTAEGALEAEQKHMIEGILEFRDVDVAEIMTPRTELECLDAEMPLDEAVRALDELHHSRIPVYEDVLDKVVGIVYVRDLLSAAAEEAEGQVLLRGVMREPLFVPETKTVGSLLQQFQDQHVQIAVALDEYGGVSGVVTVEDILEEIVGEIEDEYDEEDHESRVLRQPSGGVEFDARVHIDEVNELLGLDIPEDEDYDTIGGYVTAHVARVPEPGEEFQVDGMLVRVLHSDKRRVRRVFLERMMPPRA